MQEIDSFGEIDHNTGIVVMTHLLGTIRRAVRQVLEAGFKRVVITADHGFLLVNTGAGDAIDSPEGKSLSGNRRYWLGYPAKVPDGATSFDLADSEACEPNS